METLMHFLDSIYPLSDSLKAHLRQHLKHREIKKKDYLLKAGATSSDVCFILSGLLRCFKEKNDNEVSSWFMKEGDVVFAVKSFHTQTSSLQSIQALEDTSILYISHEELQYIYNNFIEFNYNGRVLTEHYHQLWDDLLDCFQLCTPLERYQWLLKNHAALLKRVPAKYLASYLGVTEVTLSRIKRQIAKAR